MLKKNFMNKYSIEKRMAERYMLICFKYISLCVFILFITQSTIVAQETLTVSATNKPFEEKMPVIVNGKVLFELGGVTSYTAEERARNIAERIRQIADDKTFDIETMKVVQSGDVIELYAGKRLIMGLVNADAVSEGIPIEILAGLVQNRIKSTITEYRRERTPGILLIKTGYALAATLLSSLLMWGFLRLFAWLNALTQRRIKTHIELLESKSHYIIRAEMLLDVLTGVFRAAKILTILVVTYAYLNLVLGLYPWTRMFAQRLFAITIDPLRTIGIGLLEALPNLFFIFILFIITRYILKLTRLFFSGVGRGSIRLAKFEREWALPTYKIIRLLVISFAVVIAYPYIPGSSSDAFKGISIFLGVIFSLGSSSVLSHVIAGYTLTYRSAFKIGDRVKINDIIGDVEDMSLLVTRMRSLKNEEIVIPNSIILNSNVINFSTQERHQGLILHTAVGIGYEVPWRQVEAMLLLAAEKTPGIKMEPRPFVLQQSLGDFAVNYELNVYCDDALQMMQLYTALHRNILDVFNEYGVQIMTPNYEHDTEQPKVVSKDQWYAPPAQAEPPDKKLTKSPDHPSQV